jgi:hypothetical protein
MKRIDLNEKATSLHEFAIAITVPVVTVRIAEAAGWGHSCGINVLGQDYS